MNTRTYGIDLGTSTLKIYKKGEGVILDEKNVIAIQNRKKVIAVGDTAYEMLEKAPISISVSHPVRNGVIADIANMQSLLNTTLKIVENSKNHLKGGMILIAVPTDITDVEKRAFLDLIASSNAKAKTVGIVEKPIADALGVGLDVTTASGVMLVNIGADTTEISILSLGGIVLSKLVSVGGNKFDESIKLTVKKKYNLLIGDKTAEFIKISLADAVGTEEKSVDVYGRNVVTGLPSKMNISSSMVHESLKEYLSTIVDSIKMILERTPPEISSDIIDSGIYVTGGSANIKNLDKLFSTETDLKINICEDSSNTVVRGLGVIMEQPELTSLASIVRASGTPKKKG